MKLLDGPDDGLNKAPWWAQFLLRIGIPTGMAVALAVFLLWVLMGVISGQAADVLRQAADHYKASADAAQAMQQTVTAVEISLRKISESVDAQVRLQRLSCLGMAKTVQERTECLR